MRKTPKNSAQHFKVTKNYHELIDNYQCSNGVQLLNKNNGKF